MLSYRLGFLGSGEGVANLFVGHRMVLQGFMLTSETDNSSFKRCNTLTMPDENTMPRPPGLPPTRIGSPASTSLLRPNGTLTSGCGASTLISARSFSHSRATVRNGNGR